MPCINQFDVSHLKINIKKEYIQISHFAYFQCFRENVFSAEMFEPIEGQMSKIVFTNGCFDILHSGHIELLEKARALGSRLVVGINSDTSVRSIKGRQRPVISQDERAAILLGLEAVDEVRIFNELTPEVIIRDIKPDVLVKGGDWKEGEIVGAEFVRSLGGEVYSIPLKEGLSSSDVISRILKEVEKQNEVVSENSPDSLAERVLREHLKIFEELLAEEVNSIDDAGQVILEALKRGNKIMFCGNGGSASDAQHISTELVCRYETERRSLPAVALTTDTSVLTAIANDFSFENVFARQIEGLAKEGDVLVAISTSGSSPNIIAAIMTARNHDCRVVGLTSEKGRKMAALCDACVMVPSSRTSRVQEAHIAIGHIWCEMADHAFTDKK